jgi:hypothetical protein
MLKMKVQFTMGESWSGIKNTHKWNDLRHQLLMTLAYTLQRTIANQAEIMHKRPTGKSYNSWYVYGNKESGKAIIGNSQPYMYWQNYGVKPHQMKYLMNIGYRQYLAFGKYPYWGKKFIPIRTASGKIIFRRATAKSMKGGILPREALEYAKSAFGSATIGTGWYHPGYEGKNFVDWGINVFKNLHMPAILNDVKFRGGSLKLTTYRG